MMYIRVHNLKGGVTMLVINVKEGESIERALKRYKRKHSSTGVVRKLRADRYHTKPAQAKRRMNMKASPQQYHVVAHVR